MEISIAIGHVIGALVMLIIFSFGALLISGWGVERNRKGAIKDMSLELGISIEELSSEENQEKIFKFSSVKFSNELIRNRLSDLCGVLQVGWGWLGVLLQISVFLGVIWYMVTDDLSNAIYAWWIVGVGFSFWFFSIIFSLLCKLVTGRLPGQARQVRKMLYMHLQTRHDEIA